MKQEMGKIDITPRWEELSPLLIEWLETGKPEQKKLGREEVKRIAELAQALVDYTKSHPELRVVKCKHCGKVQVVKSIDKSMGELIAWTCTHCLEQNDCKNEEAKK